MAIELGDRVKDKISGFEGVATGIADYISGCRQIAVSPKVSADNKLEDGRWFDDDRLDVMEKQAVTLKDRKRDGGPQSNPAPIR
jgi:hypothetical protein